MKRFLTALAVLLLVVVCAAADSEFTVAGSTLIKYNGPGGEVTVPEGITELGEYAFTHTNVTKVNLPNTLKVIRSYCFSDCPVLEEITLPASLTELEKYTDIDGTTVWQAQVFCRNPRLTAINVEKGNNCYTSIDGVLFSVDRKKLIYYPDGKNAGGTYAIPEGTEEIGYSAFSEPDLTGITFPDSLPEPYRSELQNLVSRKEPVRGNLWESPMVWAGAAVLLLAAVGLVLHLSRRKADG